MFVRNWKKMADDATKYDNDTLPERTHVLEAIRQIHDRSLSLVVDAVQKAMDQGSMLTHASDSTTRRHVGQFIRQGLHIGKEQFTLCHF